MTRHGHVLLCAAFCLLLPGVAGAADGGASTRAAASPAAAGAPVDAGSAQGLDPDAGEAAPAVDAGATDGEAAGPTADVDDGASDAGLPLRRAVVDEEPIPVPPPPVVTPPAGADAGPPALAPSEPKPLEGGVFAATYREQISPLEFRVPIGTKDPKTRAAEASAALAAALDSPPLEGAPLAAIRMEGSAAVVRVQGRTVAHLYAADALAAGAPSLASYAEEVETRLYDFVGAQLTRTTLQTFALHVFLSVFIGVLVFLTLRALRTAFDRWDQMLVDRGADLKPISIFKVPIVGGEALRGLLAFGLAVGRAVAYAVTVLVGAVAILGQFDATRPFLRDVIERAAEPLKGGLAELMGSLPRLLLVAALIVALRAALKVIHILLDGVSSGRVQWKPIPPARVPVARAVVGIGALLLSAPLLVAAVFGQFGTPLELLAVGLGGAVLLAAVPVFASGLVGVFVLWRATVRPGEWVEVGDVAGEVSSLSILEMVLVPEGGGTIVVPMLVLAFRPVRRLQRIPTLDVDVKVARDRPTAEILDHVRKTVKAAEPDSVVECVDASHGFIVLRVHAPIGRTGVRQALLLAVLGAVDRGELSLYDERGAEAPGASRGA